MAVNRTASLDHRKVTSRAARYYQKPKLDNIIQVSRREEKLGLHYFVIIPALFLSISVVAVTQYNVISIVLSNYLEM